MEQEQSLIEETPKEEKINWLLDSKHKRQVRGVAIGFVILSLVILIIYKIQNPGFTFSRVIIIGGALVIIGLLLFFASQIYTFFKERKNPKQEEGKLPAPASQEEMTEIARTIMEKPKSLGGYENHIKSIINRNVDHVGGNTVFHLGIKPLYIDDGKDVFDFIFNAHYPRDPTIGFGLSIRDIRMALNRISKSPSEKNIEIDTTISPLTGLQTTTRKTIPKKSKNKDKEKRET